MRLRFRLTCALVSVGLATSCGSEDNTGTSPSEETMNEGVSCGDVAPPAHIDVVRCNHIVAGAAGAGAQDECSSCCTTAGFNAASFINADHCTCGKEPADDRATVCNGPTSNVSADACSQCCDAAGFGGDSWFGGASPACACNDKTDHDVCAETLTSANPGDACECCCLANGFISAFAVTALAPECTCSGL